MRGLGPDWVPKTVTVFLDDIEPETSEAQITDLVKREVKYTLKGYRQYTINEIYNC